MATRRLPDWQLYNLLTKYGTPGGRTGDRDELRNPEILEHVDIELLDKLEEYSKVNGYLSLSTKHRL